MSNSNAKHKLNHKKLTADSGEESGVYIYCQGVMMFQPMEKELVAVVVLESLKTDMRFLPDLIRNATTPAHGAPSQGEGTHGAGSDNPRHSISKSANQIIS